MEILKGLPVAQAINEELIKESQEAGIKPHLAIIRVGERPDDCSYERGATKKMDKVGFDCTSYVFPQDITDEEFQKEFDKINNEDNIDGILLLRPLPKHINEKAIEERMDISGKMQQAIVINNDGLYQSIEIETNDYKSLSYEDKIEKIKEAGIVGLGGAGFPTHVKLSVKDTNKVHYFIVNGAECEPYLTSDYRLMLEKTDELIDGIHVILDMFPKAICYIAIEDNKKEAISLLEEKCKDEDKIEVKALKTKYPQGGERMLIKVLTGKMLNSKMLPADAGCIVDNVDTIYNIYNAVKFHKP